MRGNKAAEAAAAAAAKEAAKANAAAKAKAEAARRKKRREGSPDSEDGDNPIPRPPAPNRVVAMFIGVLAILGAYVIRGIFVGNGTAPVPPQGQVDNHENKQTPIGENRAIEALCGKISMHPEWRPFSTDDVQADLSTAKQEGVLVAHLLSTYEIVASDLGFDFFNHPTEVMAQIVVAFLQQKDVGKRVLCGFMEAYKVTGIHVS